MRAGNRARAGIADWQWASLCPFPNGELTYPHVSPGSKFIYITLPILTFGFSPTRSMVNRLLCSLPPWCGRLFKGGSFVHVDADEYGCYGSLTAYFGLVESAIGGWVLMVSPPVR
jgi:hypothetical protein